MPENSPPPVVIHMDPNIPLYGCRITLIDPVEVYLRKLKMTFRWHPRKEIEWPGITTIFFDTYYATGKYPYEGSSDYIKRKFAWQFWGDELAKRAAYITHKFNSDAVLLNIERVRSHFKDPGLPEGLVMNIFEMSVPKTLSRWRNVYLNHLPRTSRGPKERPPGSAT